jgi:hypothetical protein
MIEKMCFGGNRREFLFALLPSFCQEIRPSREKFYVPVRVGCWPLRARVDGNRFPFYVYANEADRHPSTRNRAIHLGRENSDGGIPDSN